MGTNKLLLWSILYMLVTISPALASPIIWDIYPHNWTQLQGGTLTFHLIIASACISKTISIFPSSSSDIRASFFSSDNTLKFEIGRFATPGSYRFQVTLHCNREKETKDITIKVVPNTDDGAYMVLCETYAKFLSPKFWSLEGINSLMVFESNFYSTLLNPIDILLNFVPGSELLDAMAALKAIQAIIKSLKAFGISYALGWTWPQLEYYGEDWELKDLVTISSLIYQGQSQELLKKIDGLLPKLKQWLNNLQYLTVDYLIVTNEVKQTSINLVKSCIDVLISLRNRKMQTKEAIKLGPFIESRCINPPFTSTIFYENIITFYYTGGKVILSSTPDGNGSLSTDDEIKIIVTHPDGSTKTFRYIFGYPKHINFVETIPPQDITHLFAVGRNIVRIQYVDNSVCAGSTAYYLVVEK